MFHALALATAVPLPDSGGEAPRHWTRGTRVAVGAVVGGLTPPVLVAALGLGYIALAPTLSASHDARSVAAPAAAIGFLYSLLIGLPSGALVGAGVGYAWPDPAPPPPN